MLCFESFLFLWHVRHMHSAAAVYVVLLNDYKRFFISMSCVLSF